MNEWAKSKHAQHSLGASSQSHRGKPMNWKYPRTREERVAHEAEYTKRFIRDAKTGVASPYTARDYIRGIEKAKKLAAIEAEPPVE